jgi:hypothetical protein
MDKVLLAKQEKWHRSNLTYLLHDGQKIIDTTFKEIKGQLFVANISRQWGKSFWAVSKCIQLALSKPKCRIKYGTAFQTDLVEFILPTFDAVLQECPESIKPKYKVQGSKWVFPNGSEIKLVGLDKSPNSLRGNVIDMIVIDEAGFVDNLQYIYSSIIVPATLHRPNCKIVFISTPPATPAHPFGDFIQMAEVQDSYVKLDIYTNPRITEADIERMAAAMGGKNSTTFRRECLCELVLDEDLALVKDWKDDFIQVAPKDMYYEFYHRYVGMDLGRKDHTALIFGYYDFKKATLFIQDELTMNGPAWTTITLKDAVLEKEKELWGENKPFRRVSDNNNPHLIMDLNSLHNVHFMETNKESLEAMVNEVRIMVGNGQVIIDPKCKMLIGCLKYGIWDKNRKEFARNKVYGHYDHFASLMYLIRNLAKHTNPIPAVFNETYKTWTMNVTKDKSKNAQTLTSTLIPKRHKKVIY